MTSIKFTSNNVYSYSNLSKTKSLNNSLEVLETCTTMGCVTLLAAAETPAPAAAAAAAAFFDAASWTFFTSWAVLATVASLRLPPARFTA